MGLNPIEECSPRVRGWSQADQRAGLQREVVPAGAGVVPSSGWA
ncbi:hypothetical protein [Streptomyces californicus]